MVELNGKLLVFVVSVPVRTAGEPGCHIYRRYTQNRACVVHCGHALCFVQLL